MVSLIDMPQILPQQLPPELDRTVSEIESAPIIDISDLSFAYGNNQVLHEVTLPIAPRAVTAFIGPSGCGKTTLIRCLNRMNDLIDGARVTGGSIRIDGIDINSPDVDVVDLRRRVGMVFQNRIPFRNRFTITSPTACALPGSQNVRASMKLSKRVCAPRRSGMRSRTGCTSAVTVSPVANNSASASRARSQSSRKSF